MSEAAHPDILHARLAMAIMRAQNELGTAILLTLQEARNLSTARLRLQR